MKWREFWAMGFVVMLVLGLALQSAPVASYSPKGATAWKATEVVVIDGNLGEWDLSSPVVLDSVGQVYRNPEKWDGTTDLSANVYVMWDESNLYVAAEVKDDTPFIYAEGMFIDMNDSMVIYISTNPGASPSRTSYESADFRVLLMISDFYMDTALDRDMVSDPKGIVTDGMYGGKNVLAGYGRALGAFPGGFTFETKIPWSCFSSGQIPLFTPADGTAIGFDVELNDLDVPCPGEISAGMAWCGDQGIQTSPSKWGTLTFKVKEIGNEPPVANFDFSPKSPQPGENVGFTDSSVDPDGTIASWSWEFGDETMSSEKNPSHSYENAKSYTVKLTVTDDGGATGTVSKIILVSELGAQAIEGVAILGRDNVLPEPFDLLSPPDGVTIFTPTPTLDWEDSSDNHSGLDHYEVWVDGANVGNVHVSRYLDVIVSRYTTAELSEGIHRWYVVAVDCAGNERRSDSTFSFEVRLPFKVENLSVSPRRVTPGENVTVSVNAINEGEFAGTMSVKLYLDGEFVDEQTVSLGPKGATTVSFTVRTDEVGAHVVTVDGLVGIFEVVPPPIPWDIVVVSVAIAGAASAAAVIFWRRRR